MTRSYKSKKEALTELTAWLKQAEQLFVQQSLPAAGIDCSKDGVEFALCWIPAPAEPACLAVREPRTAIPKLLSEAREEVQIVAAGELQRLWDLCVLQVARDTERAAKAIEQAEKFVMERQPPKETT